MSYTNYKESNILFVGKIPSNWIVRSMRSLFIFGRGRVISNEEIADNKGEYPVYSSQTKNDGILGYINTYDFKGEYVTWTTDGANVGTVFYREGKFNCTNVCGTIQPKKEGIVYLKLLPYYLNFATKEYVRYDINPKLMNNVMGDIPICFPEPLEEQKQIANYLDKQTAKIDANIAKNEELIQLLEEKRVALINQVVTKGLNPDVEMKDSGVEWIGEIPEHWEIIKIKNCSNIINDKKDFADENDKYVGLEHIESETGKLLNYSNEGADGTVNKFKKDMVLFGKLRPYLAKVINTSFDGVCSTELLVFKTNESLISKYLFYFMLSNRFIEQVNSSTYGVKMPRASPDFINSLPITLPNTIEQQDIVDYLDSKTTEINNTISKIKENIDLLEEYKTSLIHHVVTGKIDVRGEKI